MDKQKKLFLHPSLPKQNIIIALYANLHYKQNLGLLNNHIYYVPHALVTP